MVWGPTPTTFGGTDANALRGVVSNLRFENFYVEGAGIGPNINQDSGNSGRLLLSWNIRHDHPLTRALGSFGGTSNMLISNVVFANWTGWVAGTKSNRTAQISCSKRHPCYNIVMDNINLAPSASGRAASAQGSCAYIEPGSVRGLTGSGC
jgi:galacturan 1,4-alpha-galacturonidase